MTPTRRVRSQLRGFVIVWTVLTLIVGTATFAAIFYTYNPNPNSEQDSLSEDVALPQGTTAVAEAQTPSVTPSPTTPPPTATAPPTVEAQVLPTIPPNAPTDEPVEEPTMTPTLVPIEDRRFQVGIQVQEVPDFNQEFQDGWFNSVANDLQLGWVKQQVRWEILEPEKGNINWAMLDLVLPSANKFGLKVLISVVTAPDWAREPGVYLAQHGPPANPQDYADFVGAILQRYPGMVHAVEVWNEQNIDREWTSVEGLSAANYVELLRVTYERVKSIDPNVIVVSGALSPTGVNDGIGAIDDFVYMEQMIEAGLLNYTDCVGAHHNGYNVGPSVSWDAVPNDPTAIFRGPFDNPHHSWTFRSTLQGYATRIARAGGTQKLCVTEFGWPSAEGLDDVREGFEFARDNTLEEQAAFTVEALSNMEEWDIVWLAFIWNFNYGPQAGWDVNNDNVAYSLIGPGFQFRPAYDAIREWQRGYLERLGLIEPEASN